LAERRGSGGRRSIDDFVVARLTLLAERRGSGGRRSIDDFVVARLTLFTERRGSGGRKFFEKKSKIFLSIFHPLWRIRHLLYIERDTEPLRWQKMF
jgi:molybdate-binding protein